MSAAPAANNAGSPRGGTLIGYARVSTGEQSPQLQLDDLNAAGVDRVFVDTASGATASRPQFDRALDYARAGDVLVVWRLDRAGRSLRHLIELVAGLEERGIGFRSLTESIDTIAPGGPSVFHVFGARSPNASACEAHLLTC